MWQLIVELDSSPSVNGKEKTLLEKAKIPIAKRLTIFWIFMRLYLSDQRVIRTTTNDSLPTGTLPTGIAFRAKNEQIGSRSTNACGSNMRLMLAATYQNNLGHCKDILF
jgi:hypothetical protein